MPNIEPFIRWAGGKTWLIKHLESIMCNVEFNHYHEPFLGGAAMFFALEHSKKAYLSDVNLELIDTFIAVRDCPELVVKHFLTYQNTKEEYYRIRGETFQDSPARAARFIYLNQTSYNGLYRVNKCGKYNVPYGFRKNWNYNIERIYTASKTLKKANITCGDFTVNKYRIQEGDLVFLDPPYTVSHNHNGFIEYNRTLFSLDDQYRLSRYIDYIKRKGAYYILTNAAHVKIEEIFQKGDRCLSLDRHSLIGGKESKREKVAEYVFTNIPGEVVE